MKLQKDKFRDCDNFNGFVEYQLTQKVIITPISVVHDGNYIIVYFTRQKA